ncbi:MAG: DUF3826 domain-containing protein [Candidatus Synoicihabitans palmerolidicus]|nr:DUF3826 domain-containing protein [Candidatus Synoicihabitans palmerolidicus]
MRKLLPLPSFTLLLCLGLVLPGQATAAINSAVVAAHVQGAVDRGDTPTWWPPTLPEEVQRDADKKGMSLAESVQLGDAGQTEHVAKIMSLHFSRVWAWRQQVDTELGAAWAAWDEARNNLNGKEKAELKALAIATEQIDPIHAQFAPQIQALLRDLRAEIGEETTIALIDHYTRSPGAERIYNAYVAMVPEMTDAGKTILWARMAQARENAMSAWTGKQIIKIFKKYKVRNEFSLDYFGYGYRKRYSAWIRTKD